MITGFNFVWLLLWGFVKDNVYVPLLPDNLQELRHRITASLAMVNFDMVERVWGGMDYHINICRVSKDGHSEHLKVMKQILDTSSLF